MPLCACMPTGSVNIKRYSLWLLAPVLPLNTQQIQSEQEAVRIALLLHGVLGQGLELTSSHFIPKNRFVDIWWHLIPPRLLSPRFVHDPSTQKVPFQMAAGWLSSVQDPSLHCGSTHSSHTPLLLEELPFRYSPSSPSVWPQISFVKLSLIPI